MPRPQTLLEAAGPARAQLCLQVAAKKSLGPASGSRGESVRGVMPAAPAWSSVGRPEQLLCSPGSWNREQQQAGPAGVVVGATRTPRAATSAPPCAGSVGTRGQHTSTRPKTLCGWVLGSFLLSPCGQRATQPLPTSPRGPGKDRDRSSAAPRVTWAMVMLLAAATSQELGPFGPTSTWQSPGEPWGEGRGGVQEPEAGSLSSRNSRGDSPSWKRAPRGELCGSWSSTASREP